MASLCLENVKTLYRCESKEERRNLLVKILDYPTFDDEEDLRASILLDFYLDSVNYASEQGFTWQQGLSLFQLMEELRENALGLPLVQATELFKSLLKNYADVFQPDRLPSVLDYIFSVFFNHFHLYKFVFGNERENDITCYHLSIESPPQNVVALVNGVEEGEWKRQEALESLESEHNKNMMEKQLHFGMDLQKIESLVCEKLAMLDDCSEDLTRDKLKSIVEETVKMYVASAASTIKFSIEESQENLVYQFSKAAMNQPVGKQSSGTTGSSSGHSMKNVVRKPKGGKV